MTRPLITFALMAYNSEPYVEAAIAGAFSQTYEPTEIILSDDCSGDSTFGIMQKMASEYRGPHKIVLNRNVHNVGISGHINRIMELCRGELVVIAAADDVSLPNRVGKTYEAFLASEGKARSICSSCTLIDDAGAELRRVSVIEDNTDLESLIANGSFIYGCTHAWHRSVFDTFGPLPLEVQQEDAVIPFRSLALGTIARIQDPLVLYRMHGKNLSLEYKYIAKDARDLQELYSIEFSHRLNNLNCYLKDLELARDCIEATRWEALRRSLLGMISICEMEIAFRQGGVAKKLSVLLQGVPKRAGATRMMKWIFRIILPSAYVKYSYAKYRKQLKPDLLFATDSGGLNLE